ncbi:transposase [Candidatus Tisiphia endosymbiont of Dioctria rufipes]|uniref:transposase n=1 Tax=Candidatus Tisiphia endosymbiont of Dioctria rufipes TaxID=3066255 RepID=UPI0039773699
METVPGIGKVVSKVLLAFLPEIGKVDQRQIASLVGVAPHPKDSGQYKGYRSVSGGRDKMYEPNYLLQQWQQLNQRAS